MFFTRRGAGAPRGKVIWQKRARRWNWTIEKWKRAEAGQYEKRRRAASSDGYLVLRE